MTQRRVTARLPAHPAQRLNLQGNNQYRRVSVDALFAAQLARVDRLLDQHVARVRERLRGYEDDIFEVNMNDGR